jgi:deoxyribose-phosphate aldolase
MDLIPDLLDLAEQYDHDLPALKVPVQPPAGAEIAAWIDHTLLKPEATAEQIKKLCQEAQQNHFASVCVNPAYVPLAHGLLVNSDVPVCTVVGFPLGADLPTLKVVETLTCLEAGAVEIDMVLNIGALKSQAYGLVLNDILAVSQVVHNQSGLLKVILETTLLTRKEKIIACLFCRAAGAEFVKTSTGFSSGGATVEDVDLMYRVVGPEVKVKASGGIRDYKTALAMIQAGASRIGASAGVQIIKEATT